MFIYLETSLVAQTVKRLPTMRETWVQSLGWEHVLEKEMANHSSILAWKIPWKEEPGRLQPMGLQSWTRLSNLQLMTVSEYLDNVSGTVLSALCALSRLIFRNSCEVVIHTSISQMTKQRL